MAGISWRTHIMLNTMCSRLPCSQVALSTDHHAPRSNTGVEPLAPNASSVNSGRSLAMSSDWPNWHPADEFRAIRDAGRKGAK